MARVSSSASIIITLLGGLVVLCAGMVVMVQYAKVEVKTRPKEKSKPAGPEGPYAERLKQLSRKEYAATQLDDDDSPGMGRYHRTTEAGLYLDIVSGEVMFTSQDKLEPTQGYAEFSKPFDAARLLEEHGTTAGEERLNVKGKASGARLGWIVTEDGGTRRYVLNSSALRFVPAADLEKENLSQHRALFEKQ